MPNLLKIYHDTKGLPGSIVIRIAATRHVEKVVPLFHKKADTHINVNVEFGDDKGQIPIDVIARKSEKLNLTKR